MAPPEKACLSVLERGRSWLRSGVKRPRASKWSHSLFPREFVLMLSYTQEKRRWQFVKFFVCVVAEWIRSSCMWAAWVWKIPKNWWVAALMSPLLFWTLIKKHDSQEAQKVCFTIQNYQLQNSRNAVNQFYSKEIFHSAGLIKSSLIYHWNVSVQKSLFPVFYASLHPKGIVQRFWSGVVSMTHALSICYFLQMMISSVTFRRGEKSLHLGWHCAAADGVGRKWFKV